LFFVLFLFFFVFVLVNLVLVFVLILVFFLSLFFLLLLFDRQFMFLMICSCAELPQDEATKTVLTGIEESVFCRIVKRLVAEKLASDAAYKELVTKKTCFDVMRRRRRAACSGEQSLVIHEIHFAT